MTQHFYYFSPQTPTASRWTVDLGTSAIRLGDIPGWSTAAENGDVAQNGVAIDDPTGNAGYFGDGIVGLKTFYVTEDDCATYGSDGVNGIRLWTGYIRERHYRRGNQSPSTSLITGAARRIDIGLEDLNSLAAFRVLAQTSGLGYLVLTGTLSKNGTTTVTGSGTAFLTQLAVGSTISIPGGGGTDVLYVASIATNTSLTTTSAAAYTASGQTARRIDQDRPAETDVQRIQWIMSGIPAWLPVTNDAGWVDTSGPVNMDANDYTGASAADVIHDCATASGKDWWIGYWEASGTDSLWYADSDTSTAYTSLLSLTDDIADLTLNAAGEVDPTSTVWPVMPDSDLLRDPTFTFAGLYEPYENGYVYAENSTTADTYAWRDGTAPNANVKTTTKANAIATRLLAQDDSEQDRITCRVQLPSSLATGIKAGQRIQFKSTFMAFASGRSYDTFTWMRVKRCTVAQDEETDKRYTLMLELTPQADIPPLGVAILWLQYDDHADEVYVNGISHTSFVPTWPIGSGGLNAYPFPVPESNFRHGTNVIALKIRNDDFTNDWAHNPTGVQWCLQRDPSPYYSGWPHWSAFPDYPAPSGVGGGYPPPGTSGSEAAWRDGWVAAGGSELPSFSTEVKVLKTDWRYGHLVDQPANWETNGFDDTAWAAANVVTFGAWTDGSSTSYGVTRGPLGGQWLSACTDVDPQLDGAVYLVRWTFTLP